MRFLIEKDADLDAAARLTVSMDFAWWPRQNVRHQGAIPEARAPAGPEHLQSFEIRCC